MNRPMLLVLLVTVSCSANAPSQQQQQYSLFGRDGSYKFFFNTGDVGGGHRRLETRNAEGVVFGEYSYLDPNGNQRSVEYSAGKEGYVARGDVGSVGSPRSELPVYSVKSRKGDSEEDVQTEPSSDEQPQSDQKPEENAEDTQIFPGLGGKRRLEHSSDTGKLDAPSEPSQPKPPVVYFVSHPYGYYSRRLVYVPYGYPHFSYVPYAHAVRSPYTKGYSSQANLRPY